MEIIASHVNADFDSLAAMVAAQKIYPEARLFFTGSQNRNVREFISLHKDRLDFISLRELDKSIVKRLIIVDTKIADRLGEIEDLAYKPDIEIFAFDHHPPTPEDLKLTKEFTEDTGSTTTILVKIIRDKKITLTTFEATLLAMGIHEDTGSFTYLTTIYDDIEAAAYLMANGADIRIIKYFLNLVLTGEQHRLLIELLKQTKIENINGVDVAFSWAKSKEYVDGASVLTHKIADLENIDVIFNFIKGEDRIQVIGRSNLIDVDVSEILSKLNGGGHSQAASAVVKRGKIDKIKKVILKELTKKIKKPLTAKDIMSEPVRFIESSYSIQKTNRMMLNLKLTGFPVVEKGKLVGMISKTDIDKAIHRGLSHAPVKGFMNYKVITVEPDTSFYEIKKLFFKKSIGRVPVIKDSKLVGIITRTDLLEKAHGLDYFEKKPHEREEAISPGEISERFRKLLPGEVRTLLQRIGALAEREGIEAYLVGGIVRDLLMERKNLDVDIVTEGDAVEFGHKLVKAIGGRIRPHQKFGTAVIVLPNNFHIDLASARTEFYSYPAALPSVQLSSIRQDLSRRDFTFNAMCISLNSSTFGTLLDFFGGQNDIKNKIVKNLHNLSFVEDPTRIFRAVRFEQRFGFRMDSETEQHAHKAIKMELVGQLTNARIRDELVQILNEDTAWWALNRLQELNALNVLHPKFNIEPGQQTIFKKILKIIPQIEVYFPEKIERWILFLTVILQNFSKEELNQWCFQMKFRNKERNLLYQGIFTATDILKELQTKEKITNSHLYNLLIKLSPESICYILARTTFVGVRTRINFYLENLKNIELDIGGKKLIEAGFEPSPYFKIVLEEVLNAKLDGLVRTKAEEINLAEKLLNQKIKKE